MNDKIASVVISVGPKDSTNLAPLLPSKSTIGDLSSVILMVVLKDLW